MTTNAVRTIPEQFFGGQDQLKGALPPELCGPGYRAQIAGFPVMDAAGHSSFGHAFYAGFPDLSHTIDEVHTTDDGFAVRFTLRGTHTAPFMGIPATNRAIEVPAIALMSISGGKVTSLRGIFDQLGLMRQLGVIDS